MGHGIIKRSQDNLSYIMFLYIVYIYIVYSDYSYSNQGRHYDVLYFENSFFKYG
jgi:hypothetical protein